MVTTLLVVALILPVVLFWFLKTRTGLNGRIAVAIAVAVGWALNIAWALASQGAVVTDPAKPT